MSTSVVVAPAFRLRRLDAVDSDFVRRVRRRRAIGSSRLAGTLRRPPVAWLVRRLTRLYAGRLCRRLVVLLIALLAGVTLAAAPARPAHADLGDRLYLAFCAFDRKSFSPEKVDDSLGPFLSTSGDNQDYAKNPNTRWGQYGSAGAYWGTYWLGCYDFQRQPINMIASLMFKIVKWIATFAILLFTWTFRGEILDIFLDPARGPGMSQLDAVIHRINLDVFLDLMGLAVLFGALVMAWRVLANKGGLSDFIGKFIAMALVAGFAMFYGGVPGQPPGASSVLRQVNDWTNQITQTVLLGFVGDKCYQGLRNPEDTSAVDKATALDCMAEGFYETMIYEPWVLGEFGSYTKDSQAQADLVLKYQAFSWSDEQVNDQQKIDNAYGNDTDAGKNYCNDSKNKDRASTWNGKICLRTKMRESWGVGDDQLKSASGSYEDIKTNNYSYWYNWSGGNSGNRLMIAFLALVGSGAIAVVVIVLSLSYLMLEVSTIMFAMMAPVAFLMGLIPGFGTRILLRWGELILGSFVRRIVLGLFIGLVMALYAAIMKMDMPWMMQLIMVVVIAFFGFSYRRKFSESFSFNFSGSNDFFDPDDTSRSRYARGRLGEIAGAGIGSAMYARVEGKPVGRSVAAGLFRGMSPGGIRYGYHQSGTPWVRGGYRSTDAQRRETQRYIEEEEARRRAEGNNTNR